MNDVCELSRPPATVRIVSASIAPAGPDLLEIDPRPCGLCGLTIDRHDQVDDGEGPLFFCADIDLDGMTLPELERRADLRLQEAVAAMVAWMEAMDGPAEILPPKVPPPYRTSASTIEAFKFVVSLGEPERLEAWLLNHPQDAPTLLKLLETA